MTPESEHGRPSILDLAYAKWFLSGHRAFSPELDEITTEAARLLAEKHTGRLDLSALKRLSAKSCIELSRHRGDLDLSGLTELCSGTAGALAAHRGVIVLTGLQELDSDAALRLADHQGAIHLGGLTNPEDVTIFELSRIGHPLWLPGIQALTETQAKSLAHHKFYLCLDGLADLSPAVAGALAKRTAGLSLDGLRNLAPELADRFCSVPCLSLKGIKDLSTAVANSLARLTAELDISGLGSISDAAALALAAHRGTLHLDGLARIPVHVARSLAAHCGNLTLDGLIVLNEPEAEALALHQGTLSMDGVRSLTPAAAAHLARHQGKVSLLGLEELSIEAAGILGIRLFTVKDASAYLADPDSTDLTQYTHLTSEGVATLNDWFSQNKRLTYRSKHPLHHLKFSGVKHISEGTARLLVEASRSYSKHVVRWFIEHPAYSLEPQAHRPCLFLGLSGLRSLTGGTFAALAGISGDIDLSGLTTLSDDNARLLCQDDIRYCWQPGILNLSGLTRLSCLAASALSLWKGWTLILDGLKSLDRDTAAELGRFTGRIISLKGISDICDVEPMSGFTGFIELPEDIGQLTPERASALAALSSVFLNLGSKLNFRSHWEWESNELRIKIAATISGFRGILSLSVDFASVPPEVLNALAAYRGPQLILKGWTISELSRKPTAAHFAALATSQAKSIYLSDIEPDPEAIRELAPYSGGLVLNRLAYKCSVLSRELGTTFSTFRSRWLSLDVDILSEDAAVAINDYRGWLILSEIEEVSPRVAYLLSLLKGKILSLPIACIDRDVVAQLVKLKGYVTIDSIKGLQFERQSIKGLLKEHNREYRAVWEEAKRYEGLFGNASYSKPYAYAIHQAELGEG